MAVVLKWFIVWNAIDIVISSFTWYALLYVLDPENESQSHYGNLHTSSTSIGTTATAITSAGTNVTDSRTEAEVPLFYILFSMVLLVAVVKAILLHAIYFRHLRFVRDDRLWEGALGVAGPPFRERDTNRSSRTTKSYVLDSRPMTADDGSLFRHPTDYSTYRERRILLPAEWNVTGATKDTGNFTRSDFSYKPSIGHTDTDLSFCYVPTTRSMEKSSGPVHQSQE